MERKVVKRALCVGINDYPFSGSQLNGCVNDATAWAKLLNNHFDFCSSDIRLITDSSATKSTLKSQLKEFLLAGARPDDVLVFTNSSHGTYIADSSGDEPKYDEALCPYDVDSNVLLDDELRELFANLPDGVRLAVISDSCFSGTITRLPPGGSAFGADDNRRARFLNPALRGDPILRNPWKARAQARAKYSESEMKELLLTGCTDREYSFDALIRGFYHGAMSYHALLAIREADYRLTYAELHARTVQLLEQAGYPQHPQLEGREANKQRQVFT